MSDIKQVTRAAFITGRVSVQGMKVGAEAQVATVAVSCGDTGDSATASTSQEGRPYLLVVPPGKSSVRATLGAAHSQPVALTLQDGETAQVDFVFGK